MIKKTIFLLITALSILGGFPLWAAGSAENESTATLTRPVRIAVMPDAGALPLFLMENVEPVPFMSARERDTAMQLGELDGMLGDMVSQLNFYRQGTKLRILTVTESCFQIIGPADFNEDGLWSVGLSENTIIEFMVDRLIPGEVRAERLEKVSVPSVPVRLEMLRTGQIPLACLTDVMAQALPQDDFAVIRTQEGSGLEPAVLLFSEDFLQDSPDVAEVLTGEWNRAVEAINADPEAYRSMLYEKLRLPENADYPVPEYSPVKLPSRDTLSSVQEWFGEKYDVDAHPSFEGLVIMPGGGE